MSAVEAAAFAVLAVAGLVVFCVAAGVLLERYRPKPDPDEVLTAELAETRGRLVEAGRAHAAAVRRCAGCPLSPHYPEGTAR